MKSKKLLFFLLACYLGLHNGHLALFAEDASEPLLILPHKAEMYSQEDQKKLAQGIPYDSEEELAQILEDFLS
ncbi:MAG: hypothetical protein E7437_08210 [Ruminococcaceae bacterium]|nr:hypothetical protein [Oscillospiraceae bacterium]